MHIIENFKMLMSVDHIAWADGPGWLLGVVIASLVLGVTSACVAR